MSDGYSDMIEHFHALFDECLKFMVRYHSIKAAGHLKAEITEQEYRSFEKKLRSIPHGFWLNEIKLPEVFLHRFSVFSSAPAMLNLEELFFLLQITGKFAQLVILQQATKYKDKLIIFVGEDGRVLADGVHYQNQFWNYLDGDQDIMIGYAKKRCHRQPFLGRPVLLVAENHRYRRQCFILKDILDIHGKSVMPPRNS